MEKLVIEVREYLEAYPEDDKNIEVFINGAKEYLKSAGITEDLSSELYKLAIKMLVGNWFDNRGVAGAVTEIPFGLTPIINQLQLKVK